MTSEIASGEQGALPPEPQPRRLRDIRATGPAAPDPESAVLPQTESNDPRMRDLDRWPSETALTALWEGQLAAVAAIKPALPSIAAAAEAAAERLYNPAGRLIYCGAGTSGRLGVLDASELQPTFDWPLERTVTLIAGGAEAMTRAVENAEDRSDLAEADIVAAAISGHDVLIAVAASGTTPYAIMCARTARAQGALTIGISNSAGAPLLGACEHAILIETGPEPIAGSTRMKAGTAQKIVLNLISTQIMILHGRTWRGQMVDVVARNEKLRRRAVRIVRSLTGAGEQQARDALDESGGKAKLAILLLHGISRSEATEQLARAGGKLSTILPA